MQVIYPEKITTAATPQEAVGAAQPVDTPLAVTKPAIMPRMAEIDCECKKAMQRKKLLELLLIVAFILLIIFLYKQITK